VEDKKISALIMKELVILRHAKSNRNYLVEDSNRPLSPEGIDRIKRVSLHKSSYFENTDIILSSPAIRALHTAMIVINTLEVSLDKLSIDKHLYTFLGDDVIDYVYALNDQWQKVVIVGHNPAFTETINHFSNERINHLRTAGLAQITFDAKHWSDVGLGDVAFGQKNNSF
jgi:phosphohistidine phosphatase